MDAPRISILKQSNRFFKVSEYNQDGTVQIEIDPSQNMADILIYNPVISYYGPWTTTASFK